VPLPADWKTRLEKWWRSRTILPACRFCGVSNASRWEGKDITSDPATVALVCPVCGIAEVFLWEPVVCH
jgi:hypothetical protein